MSRSTKSTTAQGYGSHHQNLRRQWAPKVKRGEVYCARCKKLIAPGTPWDLGHVDGDKTKYSGPEHAACNRATATRGRVTAKRTIQAAAKGKPERNSRDW